jgi:uncharacterized membrane protein YqiK
MSTKVKATTQQPQPGKTVKKTKKKQLQTAQDEADVAIQMAKNEGREEEEVVDVELSFIGFVYASIYGSMASSC